MQVTKGTWRMREQCVPGSLSSSPTQEPGNEARVQSERRKVLLGRDLPWVVSFEIFYGKLRIIPRGNVQAKGMIGAERHLAVKCITLV